MNEILPRMVIILIVLYMVCLSWFTNLGIANGQANSSEVNGKNNDTDFAIHNLDSPFESGIWFNITAKVSDVNPPIPGTLSMMVYHVGDPKKPLIVYYGVAHNVGNHNIGKWLIAGDCTRGE